MNSTREIIRRALAIGANPTEGFGSNSLESEPSAQAVVAVVAVVEDALLWDDTCLISFMEKISIGPFWMWQVIFEKTKYDFMKLWLERREYFICFSTKKLLD